MGWSLLHLWPSGLSVCMDVRMHVCVCVLRPAEVLAHHGQCGRWCQPEFSVRCAKKAGKHISLKMQRKEEGDSGSCGNIFRLHSQNCLYFKSLLCPSILQEAFVTLGCFVFCVVFFSYYILVRIGDEQTYHTSDVR